MKTKTAEMRMEVSSPSPCPEQAQLWAQARLLRASTNQNMYSETVLF